MRFSPFDSSEDFMGRCGLRFSLSLTVSELWRQQWRHNERCGLHPGREPRSVAASNFLNGKSAHIRLFSALGGVSSLVRWAPSPTLLYAAWNSCRFPGRNLRRVDHAGSLAAWSTSVCHWTRPIWPATSTSTSSSVEPSKHRLTHSPSSCCKSQCPSVKRHTQSLLCFAQITYQWSTQDFYFGVVNLHVTKF